MSFVYGFMEWCQGDVGNGSDGTGHGYADRLYLYTDHDDTMGCGWGWMDGNGNGHLKSNTMKSSLLWCGIDLLYVRIRQIEIPVPLCYLVET